MMTEWGGDDCGGSEEQQAECSFVQGLADQHLQSWTLWGMNGHGVANGSFTPQQAEVLSRTYAQAVAGSVVNMTFEQRSRAFELCFEMDSGIAEPTVIYIAAATFYKDAPDISTTPNVIAHLRCYIPPPTPVPSPSHIVIPTRLQRQQCSGHTRFVGHRVAHPACLCSNHAPSVTCPRNGLKICPVVTLHQ
jgi:hypothetical protein